MSPEEKRLLEWKETLWGTWLAGMRLGGHQVSLASMKAAFFAAFESGRESIHNYPKQVKAKKSRLK